jgi:hypothetical protein
VAGFIPRLERLASKYLTRFAIRAWAFAVVMVFAFNIFISNDKFVEEVTSVPKVPVFDSPENVGTEELAWKEIVVFFTWSV